MKGSGYLHCLLALTLSSACITKGGDTFNSPQNDDKGDDDAGAKVTQKADEPDGRNDDDDDDAERDDARATSEEAGAAPDSKASDGDEVQDANDDATDDAEETDTDDGAPPDGSNNTDDANNTDDGETTEAPNTDEPINTDDSATDATTTDGETTDGETTEPEPEPLVPVNGENLIVVSGQGWVDGRTNAVGVNGPFFTFNDNHLGGMSTIEPPCGEDECFTSNEICVKGTLGEVDSDWAAIGLDVAQVDGVAQTYSVIEHEVSGFGFKLTGPKIPHLRFGVVSEDKEYCAILPEDLDKPVSLDALVLDCWDPSNDEVFDPGNGITQLRWIIPSFQNTTFDFCIEELSAYVGEGIPKFEPAPAPLPDIELVVDHWDDGDLVHEFTGWNPWYPFATPAESSSVVEATFDTEGTAKFITLDFELIDVDDGTNDYPSALLTTGVTEPANALDLLENDGFSLTYRARLDTAPSMLRLGVVCEDFIPADEGQYVMEFSDAHEATAWTTIGGAFADMKLASWTGSDYQDVTLEQCLSAATAIDLTVNPELLDGESAEGAYSFDTFGFW